MCLSFHTVLGEHLPNYQVSGVVFYPFPPLMTSTFYCSKSGAVSIIHDAFKGPAYWNGQFPPEDYHGLVMDTHIYQMFSYDVSLSFINTEIYSWPL
jgi:hypothetical protein